MGMLTMGNGKIMEGMVGESMKIDKWDTSIMGIGKKINEMVLESRLMEIGSMREISLMIKKMALAR
jgi:hypothetical protein